MVARREKVANGLDLGGYLYHTEKARRAERARLCDALEDAMLHVCTLGTDSPIPAIKAVALFIERERNA